MGYFARKQPFFRQKQEIFIFFDKKFCGKENLLYLCTRNRVKPRAGMPL